MSFYKEKDSISVSLINYVFHSGLNMKPFRGVWASVDPAPNPDLGISTLNPAT